MSNPENLPKVSWTEDTLKEYEEKIGKLMEVVRGDNVALLTVEEAAASKCLGRGNIVGFAWGLKMEKGVFVDKTALCGLVVRKAPVEDVDPDYLIENFVKRILRTEELTDVMQVGRPKTLHGQNSQER